MPREYLVYDLYGESDELTSMHYLGSYQNEAAAIAFVKEHMKESMHKDKPVDYCHSEMTKEKPYVCLKNPKELRDTCKKGHFGGMFITIV